MVYASYYFWESNAIDEDGWNLMVLFLLLVYDEVSIRLHQVRQGPWFDMFIGWVDPNYEMLPRKARPLAWDKVWYGT